jgi:uncharacterized membrane protein (UPF0127 family)
MRKAAVITRSLGVACLVGAFAIWAPFAPQARADLVDIKFGPRMLKAEVAATPMARQVGLMNRKSMAENVGMLFVFPGEDRVCMWMKDTLIPLSVAFLDNDGRVLNIADMEPGSRQIHCANAPARYALEVNRGWFERRAVQAGDVATGIDNLSAR